MLTELFTIAWKPFDWVLERYGRLRPALVEGPTEQFQSTESPNTGSSLDTMGRKRPNEHTERDSKRARVPNNERHERHIRTSHNASARGRSQEDQLAAHLQLVERHRDLEKSHRELSDAHQGVQNELRETQAKSEDQQKEINHLKEKLHKSSALVNVRGQELKAAKAFLSKEDLHSVDDVVQAVRDLNSEVMQTATRLTDNLALKRVRNRPAGNILDEPYNSIFTPLAFPPGPWDGSVDAASLELALHGFLIVWVYWIANAWGFYQGSGWCDELYSKVRENEDPAVASNWRALTRRTLSTLDSDKRDLPIQVVKNVVEQLASLLASCGVGESFHNAQTIHQHAADKFGSLFAAARKLNKMIGEDIVSGDLEAAIIAGGHPFNGEDMEEDYTLGGARFRTVICTTSLGLCDRKSKELKMWLKPKVVLRGI